MNHYEDTFTRLRKRGRIAISVASDYLELQRLLAYWTQKLGVELVFDPEVAPEISDYFAAGGLGALAGALTGAALGGFIGALLNEVEIGVAVGAGLFAVAGAAGGVSAVENGIRVRVRAPIAGQVILELL